MLEDDEKPIFGRTDLRKGVSEAKFDVEADFDVKKSLAPPKAAENHETPKTNRKKKFKKKFSASKNRKLQIVRNAFCRSFAAIRAKYRTDRTDRLDRAIARPIVPKLQTAQKSRGWLRFGRKFDRIDRSDENYHLKTLSGPHRLKKNVKT